MKGRKLKYKKLGLTLEEIKNIYEKCGTVAKAASVIGVSEKTFKTYLKIMNYPTKRGAKMTSILPENHKHYSKFIEWIRENSEISLPRSIKKIELLTGCSYNAVRSYLYRRKKNIQDKLIKIPDLTKINLFVRSTKGKVFSTKTTKEYKTKVDSFNLKITFSFITKANNPVNVVLTWDSLLSRLKQEHHRIKSLSNLQEEPKLS